MIALLFSVTTLVPGQVKEIVLAKGITAKQLNSLIESAATNTRFRFKPGTYIFKEPLIIETGQVSLLGSTAGKTRVVFHLDAQSGHDQITIGRSGKRHLSRLRKTSKKGARHLNLNSAGSIKENAFIWIARPNDQEYIDRHNWNRLSKTALRHRYFRESIHRIVGITKDTVTLDRPLPFEFSKEDTAIREMDMVESVTLANLELSTVIKPTIRLPESVDFSNRLPAYHGHAVIRSRQTAGLTLRNISIANAPSKAIALDSSLNARLDEIKIDGSYNKGPSGDGYGIELHETFASKLTNLNIQNVRHAVLFSSWHAETDNVIHVSNTNRDINFHGSEDVSNHIIIDQMRLTYNFSKRGGRPRHAWSAISPGGRNHAKSDFLLANRIEMKNVISAWRNDVLIAHNAGSDLSAAEGDDFIWGGKSNDKATGGPGADRFYLRHGENIITDFDPENDILIFNSNDADHLTITQQTDGTRIQLKQHGSIMLKGIRQTEHLKKRIQFCAPGCLPKTVIPN